MAGSVSVALRKAVTDGFDSYLAALTRFNTGEREVSVTYAWDRESRSAQQVYTGRSQADTPPASQRAGRNYRDERGTFDVTILVAVPGGSPVESDERAFEIGQQFEEFIADRKSGASWSIPGLNWIVVDGWDSDYRLLDIGAATLLTYHVTFDARLT